MKPQPILDLADCTEFAQILRTRPPRLAHATVLLLSVLLSAALVWAALTQANLVARAAGRVRPISDPMKVVNSVRGEVLSAGVGGRVVAVDFRPGDTVRPGQVLVRLDDSRLVNDIARRQVMIQAGEEELGKLDRLEVLLRQQFEQARAKAAAELASAQEEIKQAQAQRTAEIRIIKAEWEAARDALSRSRRLAARGACTAADLAKDTGKFGEIDGKLRKAQLPVVEGRLTVLREALALVEKDYAVKREELAQKHCAKKSEVDSAQREVANMELEKKQAVLRAPVAGVVTSAEIKVGDVLEAGHAVIEIAEQEGFRFEARVASDEVGQLKVGMPARIKLDAYDYRRYGTLTGKVCFLSPDSGVKEGESKAYYLVRVELDSEEIGRGDFQGRVRLGMGGQVEIVTGQDSLLTLLVKNIRQSISLE